MLCYIAVKSKKNKCKIKKIRHLDENQQTAFVNIDKRQKYAILILVRNKGAISLKNIWHDISPKRISPEQFFAVIEIGKGSKIKYELDKETGFIKMDRILHTSTHYPANYGFIPRTYSDDNDPLDVLVLCSEKLIPLTLVKCYPIGVIKMMDNDHEDNKIIAVPVDDPNYNMYMDIEQLPKHIFDEMKHFFTVYKELESKTTVVDEIAHADAAKNIIAHDIENYIENFCK